MTASVTTATASINQSSLSSPSRRSFRMFGGRHFSFRIDNIVDCTVSACTTFVETFVLLVGPLLICFASAIIAGLSWTFFVIYLPMMQRALQNASPVRRYIEIGGNIAYVVFVLVEICAKPTKSSANTYLKLPQPISL